MTNVASTPAVKAGRGLLKKMHTFDHATEAESFDYSTEAELFSTKGKKSRRQPLGYKRFVRAADAIRFAIEELPPQLLSAVSYTHLTLPTIYSV